MVVVANGFPKSGNHSLVKALELLGVPAAVNHIPYAEKEQGTKYVLIKRDPRNLPISYLRWMGKPVSVGMYLSAYRKFIDAHLVDELAGYLGWLDDEDTFVVSYEKLLSDPAEIKRIAAHLDVPYIDGAFEMLEGHTKTWIDKNHSDFRAIWCGQIDDAWTIEGGLEMQTKFGY